MTSSASRRVVIDGASLTIDDVIAIGEGSATLELRPESRERVRRNRAAIDGALREGRRVYGAGPMLPGADAGLEPWQVEHDIVRGTAAGLGPALPSTIARAVLAIRLNGLARGHSGVRVELLEAILAFLEAGLAPWVPSKGSAGASGDLAPSAHAFLPLLGEGSLLAKSGERIPTVAGLADSGLEPFRLAPKEAIAILNGTHAMAAAGAHLCRRVQLLLDSADAIAAMTIDALRGFTAAFDQRIHELRPLPGQQRSAEVVRRLLEGSRRVDTVSDRLHDPYTLRCVPQVHGSARHAFAFLRETVASELNSVTDNPLVFDDPLEIVSAGNFHGQPLALVFDTIRLALADLGAFSERRTFRLVSPSLNGELPPYLVGSDGRGLGYMIPQFACTTLVAELRVLAQPVSIDTVPTLDNIEDHVSFGMNGVLLGLQACDVLTSVLAIEAIAAAQALEGGPASSRAVAELRDVIRASVPPLDATRPPADDIETSHRVLTGAVWEDALRRVIA